jgi:hypothetical protein
VVLCHAVPSALDELVPPGFGTRTLRTAPDEALFVGEPAHVDDIVREVGDRIAALDTDALVLDVSDGWAAWSLAGHDAAHAFSYLSPLEPPIEGFVQGDVARVGAKVYTEDGALTILVATYHCEHIRERALADAQATEVAP